MTPPPALIIAFLRLEGLRRVVSSLVASNVSRIYIAIDAPRNAEESEISEKLIEYVDSLSFDGVNFYVWVREKNLGVAVSVLSAVDWFFKFEDEGMILEDDLDFDDSFIKFVSAGLQKYRNTEEVLMISGNYYGESNDAQVHFIRYPQIWGWATWAGSWKTIRKELPSMEFGKRVISFNRRNAFWNIGVTRVRFGLLDTWDLPLAALMLRNEWLCCLPPVNLVSNLGNDEFSTHTLQSSFPLRFPISQAAHIDGIDYESQLKVDFKYEDFLENKVFRIKKKHSLLFLKQIVLIFKVRLYKKDDERILKSKLENVSIPDL